MECEVEPNSLISHFLAAFYNSGENMDWVKLVCTRLNRRPHRAGQLPRWPPVDGDDQGYGHANEERFGAAIEALDAAGKTGSAEALAAARWKRT